MPVFTARENVRSGVPFGGIGAGKFEILPNGLFNAFTFQNNWSTPLLGTEEYPGILGYHLAVSVEPEGRPDQKKTRLLQTVPIQGLPTVRNISYDGSFPTAKLTYDDPSLGVDVTLEVFSPWIPGDAKHSALPAAFFRLTVKNRLKRPARIGVLFIGRNLCGEWCVGRRNRVHETDRVLHLDFSNVDPSPRDVKQGTLRFSFDKQGWDSSFVDSWNAVTRNFSFNSQSISLKAWDWFVRDGRLPNHRSNHVARGENQELCGAVALHRRLAPGRSASAEFTAAWHFPKHHLGHRYERWFPSAAAVSDYAFPRRAKLHERSLEVERTVLSFPFPKWFNEALLANLAPFNSSSWFVKDGRFSFYEAPVICPLMGTLDVGFYGSIPLAYLFPELELSQMRQFAAVQRADGYVPHDLGKNRLDLPSDGTTFYLWKDLSPKFALMAWRDALWSKERKFLREIYPSVKKAMLWSIRADLDGDGLPDHEGADHTFDLWDFRGANAYTASIHLAALLACRRMARETGDRAFEAEAAKRFAKGRHTFETKLWNGRWFGEVCALSQLNGQWYANLLGLGYVASRAKVRRALAEILARNSRGSRFGFVNSTDARGRLDVSNDHSKNVWSGMNYAFASLCVSEGFALKPLMAPLHKLWSNISARQKSPWNQPDTIDSKTGRFVFGDSYYRNMAIWSIPIAHAARDARTARLLARLRAMGRGRSGG